MRSRARRRTRALPALFALIVLGFVYVGYRVVSAPARGPDGCPARGALSVKTMLVDASEPLNDQELAEVTRLTEQTALGAHPDVRFSMFTAGGGEEADLLPVFSGCSLAREAGILTGDLHAKSQVDAFLEAPNEWLSGLAHAERSLSPLFESNDRLLYRPEIVEADKRHLVFISDLLQNSPVWSVYPGAPGFRSGASEQVATPPSGAAIKWDTVTILMIQRVGARHLQDAELEALWIAYFAQISKTAPVLRKL